MPAETDVKVKVAIYRAFAETGRASSCDGIAARTGLSAARVRDSLQSLRAQRLLFLEPDGVTIRMAPPFSGVPTYHVVESGGVEYYANCAWDSLGILATSVAFDDHELIAFDLLVGGVAVATLDAFAAAANRCPFA